MQGTTPSVTITIDPDDFQLSSVTAMKISFKQDKSLTWYTKDDFTIDSANTITKVLTEEETARMKPGVPLVIQGRFWLGNSVVGINKISIGVSDMQGVGSV
jgi:hypothetical protein